MCLILHRNANDKDKIVTPAADNRLIVLRVAICIKNHVLVSREARDVTVSIILLNFCITYAHPFPFAVTRLVT